MVLAVAGISGAGSTMISFFVCNGDETPHAHTVKLAAPMHLKHFWTDESLGAKATPEFTALPPQSARLIVATKT
jgi:hypothetical protein